uniref:Nudix hydrolase domain-containing protein n=1 Tax=Glossina pallidipes TaxID=7398 RepID=A0A1A9ZQE6_GLOPL
MWCVIMSRYQQLQINSCCSLHRLYGASTNSFTVESKSFTSDVLLNENNRQRCMKAMKQTPPVAIKRRGTNMENAFASVLIAICTNEQLQNPSLLYTRRSRMLSRHMSQISFPGGIKEENEDFIQCALRETEEEIGLKSNRIDIWGTGSLLTPPHTAAIMPVVGVINHFRANELKLNEAEVDECFTITFEDLCHPSALGYTQFKSGYSTPVFRVGNKRIWGITGFLTNIFLNCFLPPHLNQLKGRVKFIKPIRYS